MSILMVKKYCLLINIKLLNQLNVLVLLEEKVLKSKQNTIKDQEEKQADGLKALKPKELKPKDLKPKE